MNYLDKYISLALAFIFVGIIKSSPLSGELGFILAALIVMAIIVSTIQRKKTTYNMLFSGSSPEIFFITSIVLLMIEVTGGANSQLYFLNYFLLFGIPLLSTPKMTLMFVICMFLLNIPDIARSFSTDLTLKLGSILLLMPLSYFLSNELMKRQRENQILKEKAKAIEENAQALETDEDDIEAREKLDDIIESAEEIENQKS